MKLVRFNRHFDLYNAGETAGFADALADQIVARGAAIEVDADGNATEANAEPAGDPKPVLADPFEDLRKDLDGKTKADLVAYAADAHSLALSERSTKPELIEAIVAAEREIAEKAAAQAAGV